MINPPRPRRILIAPKLKTLSIEARPSNPPLGRAVFTDLLVRLIRAGQEDTSKSLDAPPPTLLSSINTPPARRPIPRKVAS